jgi:hypothetical protein
VTTNWIAILAALAAVAIVAILPWLRRRDRVDLGTVSHAWIAEQRFGATRDPRR